MSENCERCKMMGREVASTITYVSPIPPEKGKKRITQQLCGECFAYDKARTALIPTAEKFANYAHGATCKGGSEEDREVWAAAWNRAYHTKMNELAKGLHGGEAQNESRG
jgi:hypothetical protein